jgi:sarcosine oxidase
MEIFDLAILGVGGMGSAALWSAARQGLRVIGLEQFGPGHDRGSSHGQTRIIRTAYFEHPSYVPMAQRSFALWREIERLSGAELLRETGLLQVGMPESPVIRGVLHSASKYGLPVSVIAPKDIERRWPAMRVPVEMCGVFEVNAGYLRVEQCCAQLIRLARELGADYRSNTLVKSWHITDGGLVQIETDREPIVARKAVISGGPWASILLSELRLDLHVVRKQQQWFQVDRADTHVANGFCCFLFETDAGCFYGFPAIDRMGMKFAEHTGGQPVSDPYLVDREVNQVDLARVENFMSEYFRFGRTRLTHSSVCMYTKSVDEHFIVDCHPRFPQISFVAGLSGHGFKFAPVLADHLVGLVHGQPDPNCEFLSLKRLG